MRIVLAVFVSAIALAGCTAIVSRPDQRTRCAVAGAGDPCPVGSRCVDGYCTSIPDGSTCMPTETGCNGVDDNCDGTTDEGSDVDNDGYTWCAAEMASRDCRDDNRDIHPGVANDDPCDGADNDCDGTSAMCEVGTVCDAGVCRVPDCTFFTPCGVGERCDTTLSPPDCVPFAASCTPTSCTGGLICDPVSAECVEPFDLGEECAFDVQCGTEMICAETVGLEVNPDHVGGAAKICTKACCTHADCPFGSSCWTPGTGARGCVPDSIFVLGGSGSPTENACANNGDCGASECVLTDFPAYENPLRTTYACGAASRTTFCGFFSDVCPSGVCVEPGYCSDACATTSDCPGGMRCGWVFANDTGDIVPSCVESDNQSGLTGATCGTNDDCRDNRCIDGTCADVCCSDDQCRTGSRCRPSPYGGRLWVMLCVEA